MSYSAAFLLEVSEPVSLKITTEDCFSSKKCQNFTLLTL